MRLTFNQIKKIANEAIKEKFENTTEKQVKAYMIHLLEKKEDQLILEALGLNREWGDKLSLRWDGSFARIVKVMNESKLNQMAKEIWNKIADETEIVLTEKEKQMLAREYRVSYLEACKEAIHDLAEKQAEFDAKIYFQEYLDQEVKGEQ
jgi:maltodextrin utilization protein YvdJ